MPDANNSTPDPMVLVPASMLTQPLGPSYGGYQATQCLACGAQGWEGQWQHKPECPVNAISGESEVTESISVIRQIMEFIRLHASPGGFDPTLAESRVNARLDKIAAILSTQPAESKACASVGIEPTSRDQVMQAAAEAFGYEGGLQTINESDLTRFAELLATPPAAPATEAPTHCAVDQSPTCANYPACACGKPAATEAPSEPTTQQILLLERRSNMSDDEAIRFARAVLFLAARTCAPAVGASPEVTDAMVAAYLKANDAYWKRTDELPGKADKWRTGTPTEATRESLIAALAAVGASVQPVQASLSDEHLSELEHVEEALRQIAGGTIVSAGTVERIGDIRRARGVASIAHRRLSAVIAALASSTPTKSGETHPTITTMIADMRGEIEG